MSYATNRDVQTGIPYGIIKASAIDADLLNDLCYSHGKDETYDEALAAYLVQERSKHEAAVGAGEIDPEVEFDEDFLKQEFSDHYECDEPVYSGVHEGVTYCTTWLGGAQLLWVFKSPVVTKCLVCSPCVPDAGDLDSVGDYEAYGVPVTWLTEDFLKEQCVDAEFEFTDGSGPHYWRKVGDDSVNGGPFYEEQDSMEDCYRTNLQRRV